eukprot:9516055-Alexandrium_andersonii.AAC.1
MARRRGPGEAHAGARLPQHSGGRTLRAHAGAARARGRSRLGAGRPTRLGPAACRGHWPPGTPRRCARL